MGRVVEVDCKESVEWRGGDDNTVDKMERVQEYTVGTGICMVRVYIS